MLPKISLATIWQKFEHGVVSNLTTILIITLVAVSAFMFGTKIKLKTNQQTTPIVINTTSNDAIKAVEETITNTTTTVSTTSSETPKATKAGLININTATAAQLDELEGIGPSKAAAIIEYRKQHGGFKSISEINNVSGIGDKTYEGIKDRITI